MVAGRGMWPGNRLDSERDPIDTSPVGGNWTGSGLAGNGRNEDGDTAPVARSDGWRIALNWNGVGAVGGLGLKRNFEPAIAPVFENELVSEPTQTQTI
jgi:hypothetical protein